MKALKELLIFMLIASVLLGGCSAGDGIIDSLHKVSISDILETDFPCVNAEELYERKKASAPPELLSKYGFPSSFDGTNIYFLRDNAPSLGNNSRNASGGASRTALIAYYDISKEEFVTLFEEDSSRYIFYNLAGVYNSCIYYFRGEAWNNNERITTQLYRLSLYAKQPEMIINFEMPHYSCNTSLNSFCTFDRYIFFSDGHHDESGTSHLIYRYNTQSGQIEEFINDAKDPIPFKDGIAYFKETKEKLEIHYLNLLSNEDKVLDGSFESVRNNMGYSGGGDIFLETVCYDEDENPVSELGYIDSDGSDEIITIATLPENDLISNMTGNKLLLIEIYGDQLIYDSEHRCFAKLNINREYSAGYASENSVLFFCYDNMLQNLVIYTYTPRDDGRETTLNSEKGNKK